MSSPNHSNPIHAILFLALGALILLTLLSLPVSGAQFPDGGGVKLAAVPFPDDRVPQIIGGEELDDDEFQFAVWVNNRIREAIGERSQNCTASVISPRWVITAAHCLESDNDPPTIFQPFVFEVLVGHSHSSARRVRVERIIIHPDYRDPVIYPDVALLELTEDVAVEPVKIIDMSNESLYAGSGADAVLIGGGGSDTLRHASFRISASCPLRVVTDHAICIEISSARQPEPGDSGGPLVVRLPDGNWAQVGIAKSSGTDFAPLTRIATIRDWISQYVSIEDVVPAVTPPTTPTTAEFDEELYFPHFFVGSGITSDIVMINPSETESVDAEIHFFGEQGEPLNPITQEKATFAVPPFSTMTYSPYKQISGSAIVRSNGPMTGFVRYKIQELGTAGVPAWNFTAPRWLFPVRGEEFRTGVAIFNPKDKDVSARVTVVDKSGNVLNSLGISVPARGKLVKFARELAPGYLENGGQILIQTYKETAEQLVVIALEIGLEKGDFNTIPVVPLQFD